MKKEHDELTNLFRTRLEDAQMLVREGFWEELQQDIPVVISRRKLFVRRFSAAASVLLILAGASAAFWHFSPKEEIAIAFTQMAVSTGTSAQMSIDVVHEEFPVIHPSATSSIPSLSTPAAVIEEEKEESFSFSFSMSFSFSSSATPTTESQHSHADNGYDRPTTYAGGLDKERQYSQLTTEEEAAPSTPKPEKKRNWSVGLHASTGLLSDHSLMAKHQQPFSAGATVRKELSDRWGLESGLVYTQLNSKLTAAEGGLMQDQKLHYIGIPIKADLSLYKNKRLNLYASAGGMVEKCVGGDVKPNELQLSLSAGVGIQYKLSDRLSLYAEPGLSYHFDDGSPVTTIRKEKPLNMNVLCGVRMTY